MAHLLSYCANYGAHNVLSQSVEASLFSQYTNICAFNILPRLSSHCLLSYATWRDGKTVILVFNRGTEMATVCTGVDASTKAHGNFKRTVSWPHKSGFRYVFHANGDTNRELILSLLKGLTNVFLQLFIWIER